MNAILICLTWVAPGQTVVAVDWKPRESAALSSQIDKAALEYAKLLDDPKLTVPGGRTLQALGLMSVLPRLPAKECDEYCAKARHLVDAERVAFWPGNNPTAEEVSNGLHGSSSYHLPLILLLLEHQQAGGLSFGKDFPSGLDREMRFGILPPKPIRRDVARLLALLIAARNHIGEGPMSFADAASPMKIWGYRTFGNSADSCASPTGMAAIGLSAAVFGLNALDYDADDYAVKFNSTTTLDRKQIVDRLTDVCAHLILALTHEPYPQDEKGLTLSKTKLDTADFRTIVAPANDGMPLIRIEARQPFAPDVAPAIHTYRDAAHRGGYYSACIAYSLPTAARILTTILEREVNPGRQYAFVRQADGTWTMKADSGNWVVKLVPESKRRFSPLSFTGPVSLDVDRATLAALNGCLASVTVPVNEQRRVSGYSATASGNWLIGSTTETTLRKDLAGLHAFAFYKAAVAAGDGYTIGRWPVWTDLSEALSRPGFAEALAKEPTANDQKAATLALAAMTMTHTFRPVFPKSSR